MNPDVDAYIGRSNLWPDEMAAIRPLLLDAGLIEEIKWGKPCYAHEGCNIVILQEMKDFLALMFFKGALLSDPDDLLHSQGPNSRSARRMEFRSTDDVTRASEAIGRYVTEAVFIEESGIELGPPPDLVLVSELQRRLDGDTELAAAFSSLTPGRRREYNLYISGAKQASTRETRIDRCVDRIRSGRGLRDR